MNYALWAALTVAYVGVTRAIGQDMARRGLGGAAGWRYATLFFFLPYLGLPVWLIDRHRLQGSRTAR